MIQIETGHAAAVAVADIAPVPKVAVETAGEDAGITTHTTGDHAQAALLQFFRPRLQVFHRQHRITSTNDDEIIVALRKLEPNLLTSPTKSETKRHIVGYMMGVDRLFQPFGQVYQLPVEHEGRRILTKSFVDNCHERGQLVWAWTIDDAQEMGELLEMGIDGLITNRPDIAIQTVRGGDIVDSI